MEDKLYDVAVVGGGPAGRFWCNGRQILNGCEREAAFPNHWFNRHREFYRHIPKCKHNRPLPKFITSPNPKPRQSGFC